MPQRATALSMATLLTALLLSAFAVNADAEEPAGIFDPSTLKGPVHGAPNEVMVLGTAHLAQLPATFQPSSLRLLNERLLAWKPRMIAIEERSGPQCALMRQYPQRYKETVDMYCSWDPAPARVATGLDVPAATAEIDRLLASWPATPTPSQRRHLAAVFLAGGEPVSAQVQWLRLPVPERHADAGDGLDASLVAALDKPHGLHGETILIAAPLAAALGLERVIGMDDHTADAPDADPKAAGVAIAKAWDNPANARRKVMDDRLDARVGDAEGVMALYRALNDRSMARLVYDSDFGAALADDSPQQFGRGYVAWWETRNLRMASNIRDAIGNLPGSRTLVIVGASHKWYLEAYLNQMHDIRIVSTNQVLR